MCPPLNMLETQFVHKYGDKVMAADWFVVPSIIMFQSAKRDFHMSVTWVSPSVHGATTMRYPVKKKGYSHFLQITSSVPLTIK